MPAETLATAAAPQPTDPGEFGPPITRAPSPPQQTNINARDRAGNVVVKDGETGAPARVMPGSKEWSELTQAQRHEQLRGPPNPRAQGHSPHRDQREAAAARAAGEPAPSAPSVDAPALNAEKVKIGRYEISEADLGTMMDRQAQDDLRKATIPATPDAYKLEISPDAKLPGDAQFQFDGNDPGLIAAKNWAHGKGLDQSAFSEMLTLYASHVAQQESALAEVSRAEIAKSGPNAPQRMDAVTRWITAEVGEADAKPIRATIVTDAHLRFYEKLMNKISSQGTASFSQQHRVAPDTGGIPGYENMSFEQRRFAQDQQAARRAGR
jgi:hypothetical protein